MKERPSWFRGTVEGGKAGEEKPKKETLPETEDSFVFKPVTEVPAESAEESGSSMELLPDNELFQPEAMAFNLSREWQAVGEEPKDATELEEMKKESDLIHLYLQVSGNTPANFATSIRRETIREYAPALRAWTVESMHKYLSGPELWKRPSFTQAVFEEIRQRMIHGGGRLLPRD